MRSSELLRGGGAESPLHHMQWEWGEVTQVGVLGNASSAMDGGGPDRRPQLGSLVSEFTRLALVPVNASLSAEFLRLRNQFLPRLGNSQATKWIASSSTNKHEKFQPYD